MATASRLLRSLDRTKVIRWTASTALFFGLWEIVGQSGIILSIVPPSQVLPTLVEQLASRELLEATLGTLVVATVAFVIAGVVGVALGVLIGVSPRWGSILDPLVSASFSVPMAMFIPIFSIYLGLEFTAKVSLAILLSVFIIILNTSAGIREVPESVKEMARAFGVEGREMYRKIIFPWASPYIVTGLRLGVGRTVQGAILADLFLRSQDLGLIIRNANGSFQLDQLLAAVFFITILAAGTMGIARIIEWRLMRWKSA